jgi:hypothetical protein
MRFGGTLGCVHLSHRPWESGILWTIRHVTGAVVILATASTTRDGSFRGQRRGGLAALLRGFAATAGNLRLAC